MTDDPLRYDTWIEDALRGVIRRTLDFAAENGLPASRITEVRVLDPFFYY